MLHCYAVFVRSRLISSMAWVRKLAESDPDSLIVVWLGRTDLEEVKSRHLLTSGLPATVYAFGEKQARSWGDFALHASACAVKELHADVVTLCDTVAPMEDFPERYSESIMRLIAEHDRRCGFFHWGRLETRLPAFARNQDDFTWELVQQVRPDVLTTDVKFLNDWGAVSLRAGLVRELDDQLSRVDLDVLLRTVPATDVTYKWVLPTAIRDCGWDSIRIGANRESGLYAHKPHPRK